MGQKRRGLTEGRKEGELLLESREDKVSVSINKAGFIRCKIGMHTRQ